MPFRKSALLAIPAVLMTIVLVSSLSLLSTHFKTILLDTYQTKLKQVADITARILRDDLQMHSDRHFQFDLLTHIAGNSSDIRVTIIDKSGQVLGDSQISTAELAQLDNHGNRPEVKAAWSQGSALSQRFSKTLGYDVLYYARMITMVDRQGAAHDHDQAEQAEQAQGADSYIVRTALPLNVLNQQILWIGLWAGVISLLGVVVVVMISRFFSRLLDRQAQKERRVLEAQVKDRTHELSLMQRLGSLMSACTTVDSAANVVHPIAYQLLPGCSGGAITLIKSSRNRLDLLTQWGAPWQGNEHFEPSDCWSLLKGHTHYSYEDGLEIRCRHSLDEKNICQVCIPLVAQGETLGVLHLNYQEQQQLENSRAKAESMAEQIGLALANMRLREDLRQQAIRDPLTGLFNRRHMMEFLEQRIYRSENKGKALSVMMIDLDHFKRFNDTFGHDAGDYVLKQVAMELKQGCRATDLVCRYGGEELCIVCPDTPLEQAGKLGHRLVERIAGQGMQFNGQSLGTITISMGIAGHTCMEAGPERLLKEADTALYNAKEQGRNRVILSPAQPERPGADSAADSAA